MTKQNNLIIWGVITIVVLIVIGMFASSFFGPIVQATGVANIKVQPDKVGVNINVETRGKTAQEAQDKNKEIGDKLLSELVKIGFDKNELKFINIYSYPEYDWSSGKQVFKGFVMSQQLVVKTEKVDQVPAIVDASIKAGALISYINFEVSDSKQRNFKNKALEEASKDAREKANSIAIGQGKKVGRLVSLENQEFYYPGPIVYYSKAEGITASDASEEAKRAALSISPQEQEVTASIVARYKLSLF
jgi:uncharacterized protein